MASPEVAGVSHPAVLPLCFTFSLHLHDGPDMFPWQLKPLGQGNSLTSAKGPPTLFLDPDSPTGCRL